MIWAKIVLNEQNKEETLLSSHFLIIWWSKNPENGNYFVNFKILDMLDHVEWISIEGGKHNIHSWEDIIFYVKYTSVFFTLCFWITN